MPLESPFANLFMAIQNRLKELPELKWIDQNFGQLELPNPPVLFPCALIDFSGWQYEDASEGLQNGVGNVIITIGATPYTNSNFKTTALLVEKALEYYEVEHKVYKKLHRWAPNGFSALLRRSDDSQENETNLRERILVFTTSYTDTSARPVYSVHARPDPVIGSDVVQ